MGADEEMCCICLESLSIPQVSNHQLPCGHKLHERCVTEMRRSDIINRTSEDDY